MAQALARFALVRSAPARHCAGVAVRASSSATLATTLLTSKTLNEHVRSAQYAVRGEIVAHAAELQAELRRGAKLPFDRLVMCNIGNPQDLGQQPISFFREVLALVTCPSLLDDAEIVARLPADAVARARAYLRALPGGSSGSYSESQGLEIVREEVAQFITARDGFPAHASDVFLTDGASPAVQMLLRSLIRGPHDGIMTPIPQYPLYSATIALNGGVQVGYALAENGGWRLDTAAISHSLASARARGVSVRALVVINPGNPTGNALPAEDMRAVIELAYREGLVLLADEVYQENVWEDGLAWRSFRRVACAMGLVDPASTAVHAPLQLASFHSVSKGFTGECGRRGGYVELVGFEPAVRAELLKLASVNLCSNVIGQIAVGLQSRPPAPGDVSYDRYCAERDGILASLKRRAIKLHDAFNRMEGVSCEPAQGALYLFPRIRLPAKAVAAAAAAGKPADAFYCLRLLDATGIMVVPGSGFGQVDGTYHFRSTILPSEEDLDGVIVRLGAFHAAFMALYK